MCCAVLLLFSELAVRIGRGDDHSSLCGWLFVPLAEREKQKTHTASRTRPYEA